jgi:phage gp36-like protein
VPFVDDADVQIHLPVDKLKVEEVPDDREDAYEDAERIVRGYLAGVVSGAVIATWVSPATTPVEVRAVTGRFAAALIYRLRFGQASTDDPNYAQNKYKEAMDMLNDIRTGAITITGVDTTTDFDNTWFEPNDETLAPFFTMGAQF